jgi:hypothetical protein
MNDDTIRTDWRAIPALVERLNDGAECPSFTDHAIRHYVRHADENGLAPHVRRLGRKILLSESGFHAWLNSEVPQTYRREEPPIPEPKRTGNRQSARRRTTAPTKGTKAVPTLDGGA